MTKELSREDVLECIQRVVRGVLGDDTINMTEATMACHVPGWDSLSHVQIIMGVERSFSIRLKAIEVAQLTNAGSLIDLVLSRRSA